MLSLFVVTAPVAPARSATMLAPQDRAFATKAAQGGAAEVADADLALQTSRNPRVDTFATRMVNDHSKANAKLAAIMRREGIPAPAGVGAENQKMNTDLQAQTGAAFNVSYLVGQKTAHLETIALFKKEIRSGKDAQLVAFAKSTLPTIEAHLHMLAGGKM
jgi:putative membrane protein